MTTISPQARTVALIVAAAFFMQMLDGVIIATALPDMARSFGVRSLEMSIGITIYMLSVAVFIPVAGWLADHHGAKQIFLGAILLFTLASVACGLAQNLPQFVAARAVQGIGGALMVPVGQIIVLKNARKTELVQAVSLITWPALFAPVVGPALGGFITTYFTWRWNFFINIPLGLFGFALAFLFIPESTERADRPMDWRGFALTSIGLGALLYGLESLIHSESHPAFPWILIILGLLCCTLAVRHMMVAKNPLLDLTPFRIRTFAISNLFAGSYFRMAINATPFVLPLLFQIAFGLDPLQAGGLTLAYFVGNLGMKTVTTPILRRFGFRNVTTFNGVLAALSIAACAVLVPGTPYPIVILMLVIAGATRSMQFTALNTLGFADIDSAQRSSASTLSSMLQQVAMLIGIAIATMSLNLSETLRGASALNIDDFRATFLVLGALAFIAALQMLRLAPNAGAEVSGHGTLAKSGERK